MPTSKWEPDEVVLSWLVIILAAVGIVSFILGDMRTIIPTCTPLVIVTEHFNEITIPCDDGGYVYDIPSPSIEFMGGK